MKRFHVEWLILVVGFAVAVMGLMQVFHEEAYAIIICQTDCGCTGDACGGGSSSGCGGVNQSTHSSTNCKIGPEETCCYQENQVITCGTWCCGAC